MLATLTFNTIYYINMTAKKSSGERKTTYLASLDNFTFIFL